MCKETTKSIKNKKLIIKPYQGESIEVPDKILGEPIFKPPSSNFPRPNYPRPHMPQTNISKKEKKKLE